MASLTLPSPTVPCVMSSCCGGTVGQSINLLAMHTVQRDQHAARTRSLTTFWLLWYGEMRPGGTRTCILIHYLYHLFISFSSSDSEKMEEGDFVSGSLLTWLVMLKSFTICARAAFQSVTTLLTAWAGPDIKTQSATGATTYASLPIAPEVCDKAWIHSPYPLQTKHFWRSSSTVIPSATKASTASWYGYGCQSWYGCHTWLLTKLVYRWPQK